MGAVHRGYWSTHLSATPVAHWPSSYLRSSSFLCHICTILSSMGKWPPSPHATLRGVGILGVYCLNIAHDISSVPEPCCFPQPCSGKVAPGSTVSQVSSLFWVLGRGPRSMGRRVSREQVILYCSHLPKPHASHSPDSIIGKTNPGQLKLLSNFALCFDLNYEDPQSQ